MARERAGTGKHHREIGNSFAGSYPNRPAARTRLRRNTWPEPVSENGQHVDRSCGLSGHSTYSAAAAHILELWSTSDHRYYVKSALRAGPTGCAATDLAPMFWLVFLVFADE